MSDNPFQTHDQFGRPLGAAPSSAEVPESAFAAGQSVIGLAVDVPCPEPGARPHDAPLPPGAFWVQRLVEDTAACGAPAVIYSRVYVWMLPGRGCDEKLLLDFAGKALPPPPGYRRALPRVLGHSDPATGERVWEVRFADWAQAAAATVADRDDPPFRPGDRARDRKDGRELVVSRVEARSGIVWCHRPGWDRVCWGFYTEGLEKLP